MNPIWKLTHPPKNPGSRPDFVGPQSLANSYSGIEILLENFPFRHPRVGKSCEFFMLYSKMIEIRMFITKNVPVYRNEFGLYRQGRQNYSPTDITVFRTLRDETHSERDRFELHLWILLVGPVLVALEVIFFDQLIQHHNSLRATVKCRSAEIIADFIKGSKSDLA